MSQAHVHRMPGALRWLRKQTPAPGAALDRYHPGEVAAMLRQLGIALVEVEQPTQMVAAQLTHIAARYTSADVRIVVLPRMLFIQVGTVGYEVDTSRYGTTRLDVAGRIAGIAELAEAGAITPNDAIAELAAARRMRPRFGPLTTVLGFAITAAGLGMLGDPSWYLLGVYLVLGTAVGAVLLLDRPFPPLTPVLPTLAAATATVLACRLAPGSGHEALLRHIAPALEAILPGIPLTLGAMELADSSVIAGASRLVYGVVQLMLIGFGVSLGLHVRLPGLPALHPHAGPAALGAWSFSLAIAVIAAGLYLHLSAPRGSLMWLGAAVAVALIGQRVGGLFLAPAHAGAVGAFLVVPFATLASRLRTAPPAIVLMLAAFWSLVPNALSFESLGEAAAGGHSSVQIVTMAVTAIFSIALGTLIGWSVFTSFRADRPPPEENAGHNHQSCLPVGGAAPSMPGDR
ncbi:threonine/serine exporter family protein [Mycolicibacterium palauense]|uniref:threonine/serine ThrE exporter family protein n=1 Tax=Mycolicibacterium palauense TaxID=2034511 RepID=UPI000BFED3D3|nr:threonine/serine exporter family protein [Mycolicibacterium palauense]